VLHIHGYEGQRGMTEFHSYLSGSAKFLVVKKRKCLFLHPTNDTGL
jgi:hypothetical protein